LVPPLFYSLLGLSGIGLTNYRKAPVSQRNENKSPRMIFQETTDSREIDCISFRGCYRL